MFCCLTVSWLAAGGCGKSPEGQTGQHSTAAGHEQHESTLHEIETASQESTSADARQFHPILLVRGQVHETPDAATPSDQRFEIALKALGTCQALIGAWRGTTEKVIGGFGNVESVQWEWDFQTAPHRGFATQAAAGRLSGTGTRKGPQQPQGGTTDRLQPALLMSVTSSPSYFRSGRLTFLVDQQTFQFETVDRRGIERLYQGTFSATPRNHREDGPQPQAQGGTTYKLDLSQVSPATDGKLARIVINQQHPDRYLFEVYEIRDGRVNRFDTVVASRQGASHAHAESAGSHRRCLISGGVGIIKVEHAGETYWVCCEGCKSAVEKDPERWISRHNRQHGRR